MIRRATVKDAEVIARIHVRVWQTAYAGIAPTQYLADLSEERRAGWWREHLIEHQSSTLVAVEKDEVAGWISFGPSRDDDGKEKSEIYAIYVLPEFWAHGIGRTLLKEAEAGLPQEQEITLWVLEKNERALRFYERAGYSSDSRAKSINLGDALLVELRLKKRKPNQMSEPTIPPVTSVAAAPAAPGVLAAHHGCSAKT